MLFKNDLNSGINLTNSVYEKLMTDSENARRELFKDFHYFYVKDKEEIERIIHRDLVDKKVFDSNSVKKIPFRFSDIIQKALMRLSSGVYDIDPIITINGEPDENLDKILKDIKFFPKVKEALKKALFVNTVVSQVVKRDVIEIDNLMPDEISVITGLDYLKFTGIAVTRFDPNKKELYQAVWTDSEHYILDSFGNSKDVTDSEGNSNNKVNPYGEMPFSTLRINDGIDFYGEPNWDLYLNQVSIIVQLMQTDYAMMFNSFPIWVATNLELKDNEVLSPGKIIKLDNVKADEQPPQLDSYSPEFDFANQRESIDWRIKTTLSNMGLPASSASIDETAQSGVAKQIDEIELREIRTDLRNKCYYYLIDLLNKVRLVHNYYGEEKIADGEFDVQFVDMPEGESIQDTIARREMETQYNISNPITFIQEDYEVSEDEAKEIYKKNLQIKQPEQVETLEGEE